MSLSQRFALLALVLMGAALATAWGFQIIGGYVPCALCLEQRLGYYIALPVLTVALLLLPGVVGRLGVLVAAGAIAWSAGLGVYHAGAEWGYWAGPSDCGGGTSVTDAGSLLQAIEETRLVSCTEVTGRVLGLTFAGWNVVAAGTSALLLFAAAAIPAQR